MAFEQKDSSTARYGMALLLLAAISLVARFDFLAFHLVAELIAIIVSVLVFVTAVGSYRFHRNNYLLILGAGYFWVALLDLGHALTYKGMGLFGVTSANPATQLWVTGRLFEGALLAIAPFFLLRQRPISLLKAMAIMGWVSLAALAMILMGVMPAAYEDGVGLTTFKIACEWVVIGLLALALIHMTLRRSLIPQPSFAPLVGALVLTIGTELLFTLYVGVSGTINLLGHLTKFMSSWLMLEALVGSTLTRPFEMVARATESFDGIPEPVLLINRHGILLQVNAATRDWLGQSLDDIVGRPLTDVLHLDPIGAETGEILRAVQDLRPLRDLEVIDSRRQRSVLFSMAPFWNNNDDALMVVSLRDITDRQSMERELFIAKQRAETALVNSGQGLWDWNISTGEVFFSPAMETMLGYEPGTWERNVSAWERLIHPDDLPRVMGDLSRHLEGETDRYDNTHRLRHFDGRWVWVRDQGRVIEQDDRGAPTRAIGTHSDVSQAMAARSNDRKITEATELQSYAYLVSHDLKEPLRTITQQLHLLRQNLPASPSDKAQSYLQQAQSGAVRLTVMLDALLDYARIADDDIDLQPVNLAGLCQDVIRTQDQLVVETGATLSCGPNLPIALADPCLLSRCLQNILNNALKYHRPNDPPKVTISGWTEGERAILEIADKGIGISPQDQGKVLELFQRARNARDYAGNGIGLAIAQRIIDRLGGQLNLHSSPDTGTLIRLTLNTPSTPAQTLAQAVGLADAPEPTKGGPPKQSDQSQEAMKAS